MKVVFLEKHITFRDMEGVANAMSHLPDQLNSSFIESLYKSGCLLAFCTVATRRYAMEPIVRYRFARFTLGEVSRCSSYTEDQTGPIYFYVFCTEEFLSDAWILLPSSVQSPAGEGTINFHCERGHACTDIFVWHVDGFCSVRFQSPKNLLKFSLVIEV